MKAKFEIKENVCPMCNSNNLNYENIDWHGDQVSHEITFGTTTNVFHLRI